MSSLAIDIRIQQEDFDVSVELLALRSHSKKMGAVANFVGIVRDINEGEDIATMELEHYPGMTEKTIRDIVEQAARRWPLLAVTVIHRIGLLAPSDQIVFVAVGGAHRGECFSACEFIMDFLKTQAPFWKKELTPSGSRWVDARGSDEEAKQRWQ